MTLLLSSYAASCIVKTPHHLRRLPERDLGHVMVLMGMYLTLQLIGLFLYVRDTVSKNTGGAEYIA